MPYNRIQLHLVIHIPGLHNEAITATTSPQPHSPISRYLVSGSFRQRNHQIPINNLIYNMNLGRNEYILCLWVMMPLHQATYLGVRTSKNPGHAQYVCVNKVNSDQFQLFLSFVSRVMLTFLYALYYFFFFKIFSTSTEPVLIWLSTEPNAQPFLAIQLEQHCPNSLATQCQIAS